MKKTFLAELYKLRHNRPLWLLPVLYLGSGIYTGTFSYDNYTAFLNRKGLDFFAWPEATWIVALFAAAAAAAYVIAGDFSSLTIQNALSAGVGREAYYFSRLLAQYLLIGTLLLLAMSAHVICRLWVWRGMLAEDWEIDFLWQKLAVYLAVMLFQMLALVSVVNTICYFLKKHLAAVLGSMCLVYLEICIHQIAEMNKASVIEALSGYSPSNAYRALFGYAVDDQIFTFGFLKFLVSAVMIMLVSILIGYMRFCHRRDVY